MFICSGLLVVTKLISNFWFRRRNKGHWKRRVVYATSLTNGSIPEAAGKLSEITRYFHLSVINLAPSVLCIVSLLNEYHWNCKSKTTNYVEKRMMFRQFYWKCIIWPENCHEATRMIIWPDIIMTPPGWSSDLYFVMKPPGMITWHDHCHEACGDNHMTWTLSWSLRG